MKKLITKWDGRFDLVEDVYNEDYNVQNDTVIWKSINNLQWIQESLTGKLNTW